MRLHQKSILLLMSTLALCSSCGNGSSKDRQTAMEVKVMSVETSTVQSQQSFSGTIEEENGSTLSFPIAGTVKSVAVSAGQKVGRGQLLAVLDDATFQNSNEMAKAAYDQAHDAYNRLKILHDNNSLPDIQWVEVQSKLKQAESAYGISKKNLGDTRLYAPFSGYISEKNIEVGLNVLPGSPVMKLVTVDHVKVCISVPETEISKVSVGNEVRISVPALGNKEFTGRVKEKGVAANALSRSYEVKAEVNNPANELLPGMLCTLYLSGSESEQSIVLLPRSVVQLDSENRNFVWANEQGKAVRKFITLGDFVGDRVAVTEGLSAGDQVVIEGQQKISDNMNLTVIQ